MDFYFGVSTDSQVPSPFWCETDSQSLRVHQKVMSACTEIWEKTNQWRVLSWEILFHFLLKWFWKTIWRDPPLPHCFRALMLLIKRGKEENMVCVILMLRLGSRQPACCGPGRVLLDCFKSTLQRQSNERHVFLHQGDLLLGIFYLQFYKEARPAHF